MPLDPEPEFRASDIEGFDESVGGGARDGQSISEFLDALMVQAVHPDPVGPRNSVQQCSFRDVYFMDAFQRMLPVGMQHEVPAL